MAQTGLHALAGLAVARVLAPRAPAEAAVPLALAATLGAMLPDLDLYPASVSWLADRKDLAELIHRSLTHSLVIEAGIAAAGLALQRWRVAAGWAMVGLSLGMLTHTLLDILMWFAAVDLFWPLSHLPLHAHAWRWPLGPSVPDRALLPVLDIWNVDHAPGERGFSLPAVLGNPDTIRNVLGALEIAAFALLYIGLGRIAGPDGVKRRTPGLWRWTTAAWLVTIVLLALAALLPYDWHVIGVYAAMLLAFLPYAWVAAVKQSGPLAAWALRGQQGCGSQQAGAGWAESATGL